MIIDIIKDPVPAVSSAHLTMDTIPLVCEGGSTVTQGPLITVVNSPKVSGVGAVAFPQYDYDTINVQLLSETTCTGDFTLSVYVNFRTEVNTWKGIIRGTPFDIRASYYWLNCQITGGANLVGFPLWAANTWYKITVLREAGVIKLYLGTSLLASSANTSPLIFNSFLLGHGADLGSGIEKFNGLMDEFIFDPTTAIYP
jgi:hypothetical protein